MVGILLADGVGELELASVFDPYGGQSLAVDTLAVSLGGPVRTRHGLTVVARADLDQATGLDRLLVPGHDLAVDRTTLDGAVAAAGLSAQFPHAQPGFPLDGGLRGLAATVDVPTARWAAKMLGYPTSELALSGRGWPWGWTAVPLLIVVAIPLLLGVRRLIVDAVQPAHL